MQLQENPEFGLTTSQDDPYLMMNHELRTRMRTAIKTMEHYCDSHPESPCAMRHPLLLMRGDVWILLLGPSISEGITGFGSTVEAALRAFDAQYLLDSTKVIADRIVPLSETRPACDFSQTSYTLRENCLKSEGRKFIGKERQP